MVNVHIELQNAYHFESDQFGVALLKVGFIFHTKDVLIVAFLSATTPVKETEKRAL